MFWKKKCKNCNGGINDSWKFCPSCGFGLDEKTVDKEVENINKEFERMERIFGRGLNVPRFRVKAPIKSGGVSITITSGTGMPPKVEVSTSGEYRKMEPQIRNNLGLKPRLTEGKPKEIKIPKVTEEPETKIQRIGNRQIIIVNLPNVKEEDVQIKQFEQSIEIRAIVGDKAYFKLIPIPSNAYIDNEFKDGVLKIKVVK